MNGEKIATFIYDSDARRSDCYKWEYDRVMAHRNRLARRLGEEGIRLAVARMARQEDLVTAQRALQPTFLDDDMLDQATPFEPVELPELGSIILDRWSENYGKGLEGITAPIINEVAMQRYGEDKFKAYQEILQPLGIAVPTFDLHELDKMAFPAELEDTPYGLYVKPVGGALSEGLMRYSDVSEFQSKLSTLQATSGRYIVQPGYDFTLPWQDIRPYSPADELEFTLRNQPETPKELRLYCFYTNDYGLDYFPVGRATDRGNQYMQTRHRFFVDPDSLPATLGAYTQSIVAKLADLTKAQGIFMAIDFGYGAKPGNKEALWVVQEINTRFPFLDFFNQHEAVGNKIENMFARQIKQLIMEPESRIPVRSPIKQSTPPRATQVNGNSRLRFHK